MSIVSAYTTFLCNEDSNSEELQALESEVKYLIKRKFELECQLYVPRPRKFKEIDAVVQDPKTHGNIKDWDLSNLEMKMHFNKLCGLFITDADDMLNICFKSRLCDDGYYVCFKEEDDHVELLKYHVPPIVPVKELSDNHLISNKDLCKFCRKMYHFILIFEDRLEQIQTVKNSNYIDAMELFSSHSMEYVKVSIRDSAENVQKLNVHLQYRPDFIFPQKISVDCAGMQGERKAVLAEKCQVFKSLPLLEAIQIALFDEMD